MNRLQPSGPDTQRKTQHGERGRETERETERETQRDRERDKHIERERENCRGLVVVARRGGKRRRWP